MRKKIMLIATGGTISCRKNEFGGLEPHITSKELLEFVPELGEYCDIDTLQLFNTDSTNIGPEHWTAIVNAIQERWGLYDGFVITHGTDTMAYTSAALSYMIQNPGCPVVLTGSQKSIYNRDTDARNNLLRAVQYAASDEAWGVHIVFDNKVILGTRARKVRTKSFNAFSSIDYPETAIFRDDKLISFLERPKIQKSMRFFTRLNSAVFVLHLIPGLRAEIFDFLIDHYQALVIQGFGVGGLPNAHEDEMYHALEKWARSGKLTVFSTQVQYEGSDLGVYEVGRLAKELPGIMEASDMTPEAVVTKLMWVLGQTDDIEEAKQLFLTPVAADRF